METPLNEIYDWLREPDTVEVFTDADLQDWAERRPLGAFQRLRAAIDRRVTDLLEANNRELLRRREAEARVRELEGKTSHQAPTLV